MKNYIVIFYVKDWPDNGGGFQAPCFFDNDETMLGYITDKLKNPDYTVFYAAEINREIKFEQVTIITKLKIKD